MEVGLPLVVSGSNLPVFWNMSYTCVIHVLYSFVSSIVSYMGYTAIYYLVSLKFLSHFHFLGRTERKLLQVTLLNILAFAFFFADEHPIFFGGGLFHDQLKGTYHVFLSNNWWILDTIDTMICASNNRATGKIWENKITHEIFVHHGQKSISFRTCPTEFGQPHKPFTRNR